MSGFDPYSDNGGYLFYVVLLLSSTCAAISGLGYCIIAGDTRQSEGYLINSCMSPKIYQLYFYNDLIFRTEKCHVSISGFQADGQMLVKALKSKISVPLEPLIF